MGSKMHQMALINTGYREWISFVLHSSLHLDVLILFFKNIPDRFGPHKWYKNTMKSHINRIDCGATLWFPLWKKIDKWGEKIAFPDLSPVKKNPFEEVNMLRKEMIDQATKKADERSEIILPWTLQCVFHVDKPGYVLFLETQKFYWPQNLFPHGTHLIFISF